MMGQFDFVWQR